MDHRQMYKAGAAGGNPSKQQLAKAAASRRTQNRQTLFAQRREEFAADEPHTTSSSSSTIIQDASGVGENLTKAQRYYLKFLAWQHEKRANQPTFVRRPFVPSVARNIFLSPQIPNIPRNHVFRPPPNLPQLRLQLFGDAKRTDTVNEVIVTRSMAAKAKQLQEDSVAKKPSVSNSAKSLPKPAELNTFVEPTCAAPQRKILKPSYRKVANKVPEIVAPKTPPPKMSTAAKPAAAPRSTKSTSSSLRPSTTQPPPPARMMPRITLSKAATKPPPSKLADIVQLVKPLPKAAPKRVAAMPKGAANKQKSSNNGLVVPPANPNATAENASHFVLDGSMITSTAQKTKSNKKDSKQSVDLFSPIEVPTVKVKAERNTPPVDLNVTPVMPGMSPTAKSLNYVSPFVTTTRGKVSARKERKQRESVYNLNQSACAEDDVDTRQRREAATYFRRQVDDETSRLLALADQWQAYKEECGPHVLSEYLDQIDVTTGQTRLLLAKKFRQFRELIGQCESGEGEQKVLAPDLEGFWSMVYMQVEQCNVRFERLDKLKANGWQEECAIAEAVPAVARKAKKKLLPTNKSSILGLLKESRDKFRKEMQEKKAAAERAAQLGTPRKTPRKSMLNAVLVQEAAKINSPRRTMAAMTITPPSMPRVARRKSTNLGSPSPSILLKTILKTPTAKRRNARAVVFADVVENHPATPSSVPRKPRSPLQFKCTPMPMVDRLLLDDDAEADENAMPSNSGARAKSYFATADSPSNVMKRLSLSDSPARRSPVVKAAAPTK